MAYLIELPFFSIYKQLRKSNRIDEKITLFKKWLEGYVKFNLALHVAWILNQKSNDVPLNVRILLVQFFQKPPSLGFCLSISKVINGIMKLEVQNDSNWESIVYFFDNKLPILNRLLELRNLDAHTTELIDERKMIEIEGIIGELIINPIFKEMALVSSSYDEAVNSKCRLSKEIKDLDIELLFLKKCSLDGLKEIILSQKDICLFPILIAKNGIERSLHLGINFKINTDDITVTSSSLPNEALNEIFFWNKRSGDNGLYSSYLNEVVQEIKLDNITEISGFPYDDWKKTANPLYIKYLQYRKNIIDDFLYDNSIDVKTWYEEFLLACRLEVELNLMESEKIGCTEFVKGLSRKTDLIQNIEEKVFYKKLIIDSYKKYQINLYDDKPFVLNNIFFAIVYLFKYYFQKKDLELINYYFYQSLEFISKVSNFEKDPNWYFLHLYEHSSMRRYFLIDILKIIFFIPKLFDLFKPSRIMPLAYKQVLSKYDVYKSIRALSRKGPPNLSDNYLGLVMVMLNNSIENEKILGPKSQVVHKFLYTLLIYHFIASYLRNFRAKSNSETSYFTSIIYKLTGYETLKYITQRFAQSIHISELKSNQFTLSEAKEFLYSHKIEENAKDYERVKKEIETAVELSSDVDSDVIYCAHMFNQICIQENVCKLFLWGKEDFKQDISLDNKIFCFDNCDKLIEDKVQNNRLIVKSLVLKGNIDTAINLVKENLLIGKFNIMKFWDTKTLVELYGLNKQYEFHYREQTSLLDLVELLSDEERNYKGVVSQIKLSQGYLQGKFPFVKELCEKGSFEFGEVVMGVEKLNFMQRS